MSAQFLLSQPYTATLRGSEVAPLLCLWLECVPCLWLGAERQGQLPALHGNSRHTPQGAVEVSSVCRRLCRGYQLLKVQQVSLLLTWRKRRTLNGKDGASEQAFTVLPDNAWWSRWRKGWAPKEKGFTSKIYFNWEKALFSVSWENKYKPKPTVHIQRCTQGAAEEKRSQSGLCLKSEEKAFFGRYQASSVGEGGEYFADRGKNRKNLLALAILIFFFSCSVHTHWFPNMVVMCPTAEGCVGVEEGRGGLVIQPRTLAEDTLDATKERADSYTLWPEI